MGRKEPVNLGLSRQARSGTPVAAPPAPRFGEALALQRQAEAGAAAAHYPELAAIAVAVATVGPRREREWAGIEQAKQCLSGLGAEPCLEWAARMPG